MNSKEQNVEPTSVSGNSTKPNVVRRSFMWYDTHDLIDCLPQNRPLYKDSGLWAIRTDNMENVYITQNCNETLRGFIIRYLDWLEELGLTDNVWIDLACKEMSS